MGKTRTPVSMAPISRLPLKNAVSSSAKSHMLPERSPLLKTANTYATVIDPPHIQAKGYQPQPPDFEFPSAMLSKVPNREVGLALAKTYSRALRKDGICGIELSWSDPNSQFLLDVVHRMGGKLDSVDPERADITGKSASQSMGDSATSGEWPARFSAFHILQPNKRGGEVYFLRAEQLIRHLSTKAVQILTTHEYNLKALPKDPKGKKTVKGKLLEIDSKTGRAYVRYRKNTLHDPPSNNHNACAAVEELTNLLDSLEDVGEHLRESRFKENTIILVDNARCLHSQKYLAESGQWLRRVGFHGYQGSTMSVKPILHSDSAFA